MRTNLMASLIVTLMLGFPLLFVQPIALADDTADISAGQIVKAERQKTVGKAKRILDKERKLFEEVKDYCNRGYLQKASNQLGKVKTCVNRVKELKADGRDVAKYIAKARDIYSKARKTCKDARSFQKKQAAAARHLHYAGVVYSGGHRYTYYTMNEFPGLSAPGYHVGNAGLVFDKYGYLCVASSDYGYGKVLHTPYGKAKVYDHGCASGTIDVYTNW